MDETRTYGTSASVVTRRTVLGIAAIGVTAAVVPASVAHAAPPPRGPLTVPNVQIGPKGSVFTGMSGPVPQGLRLMLTLTSTTAGLFSFNTLDYPGGGESTTFLPDSAPGADPNPVPVDVALDPTGLNGTIGVILKWTYRAGSEVSGQTPTTVVTLVPLRALGRIGQPCSRRGG